MAKSGSKMILAGLAGLAAGIAVGLLIAPEKGSKTRKRLKKKFHDLEEIFQQGELSDKFDNLKSFFTQNKNEKRDQETASTGEPQS